MIIGFFLLGMQVVKFEKLGVVFAIGGVIVMLMDSSAGKIGEGEESKWIFYLIEILSAVVAIVGLQGMAETHQRTSPIRAFSVFFIGTFFFYIPVSTFYNGWDNFDYTNPKSMFYFLYDQYTFYYSIIGLAILGNLLPNMSYSLSLKGYKPQTIGCFILLEPLIGQLYGVLLGQDKMPGVYTFAGWVFVAIGSYLTSLESPKSSEKAKSLLLESDAELAAISDHNSEYI